MVIFTFIPYTCIATILVTNLIFNIKSNRENIISKIQTQENSNFTIQIQNANYNKIII
jgi:hypothetical protein